MDILLISLPCRRDERHSSGEPPRSRDATETNRINDLRYVPERDAVHRALRF